MVICYTSANAADVVEFKNLRDLVVSDAIVYFEAVVPITQSVFQDIYNTFHDMSTLDSYADFMENLDILIDDVQNMLKKVKVVKSLH